jgi:hypothetical protein
MQPVTQAIVVASPESFSLTRRRALAVLGGAVALAALSACDLPFGLGQPATRALENGAVASLDAAKSFRLTGSYTDQLLSQRVTVDLEFVRPSTEHILVSAAGMKVEAIVLGADAYFRGNEFLSQHMDTDPLSRDLVKVAGNSWWKGYGSAADTPRLPDLTAGGAFRSTFLGTAVTRRTDHASVDGLDAVELSGPRGDVYISANPPYRVLRVQIRNGVYVDGITDADLRFNDFDRDFGIAAPRDVIDFSNLSTLPPLYTVVSVDTTGCASTCSVSVLLKNLGGLSAAQAPSMVTFTMTDPATGKVVGTCHAQVQPDVGYNSTTTVACTIGGVNGAQVNAAVVTAVADNPGRA